MNQDNLKPEFSLPQLLITPPSRCLTCGDNKNIIEKNYMGWLPINLMVPGVIFLSCVKCHAVYVNAEAVGNTDIVNVVKKKLAEAEENEKKIILS